MKKQQNNYPNSVNIFSKIYKIEYTDKIGLVDPEDADSLFGHVDMRHNKIRVYCPPDRSRADVWHTIIHEVVHVIADALSIDFKNDDEDRIIDIMALGISDFLFRNGLMNS